MNTLYDEKYDIRQAKYNEIDEIMQFIDKFWKKGHILATNRDFFEYEFVINNKVNFVIAKNKETNEIEAIHGFTLCSLDYSKLDIWGCMWKVRNDHHNIPFLGLEIAERLIELLGARSFIGVGTNPKTAAPILENVWGYFGGYLNHYYRLSNKKEYKIAKINKKMFIPKDNNIKQIVPIEVSSIDELKKHFDFSLLNNQTPYKDEWYYEHRFFNHPIYSYRIFALENAFFVAREQKANGEKILRIVDYAGKQEDFSCLYGFFNNLLNEFEYIDFYNLGFNDSYLNKAGFIKKEGDINIIPDYFNPFEQRNVDIRVSSSSFDAIHFKGDSDQDRPN